MPEATAPALAPLRAGIGPADLMRSLQVLPKSSWDAAARSMGYQPRPKTQRKQAGLARPGADHQVDEPTASHSAQVAAEQAAPAVPLVPQTFWRLRSDLVEAVAGSGAPGWLKDLAGMPIDASRFVSDPGNPLRSGPLVPPARMAAFAQRALPRPQHSSALDLAWIAGRLARALPLTQLRREQRPRWPQALCIVTVEPPGPDPTRRDLQAIAAQLQRLYGRKAQLRRCPGIPAHWRNAAGADASAPDAQARTVVLGDTVSTLLALARRQQWAQWVARHGFRGQAPLLLAPLPQRLLPSGDGPAKVPAVVLVHESAPLRLTRAAAAPGPAVAAATASGHALAQGAGAAPAMPLPHLANPALAVMLGLLAGLSSVTYPLLRQVRRLVRQAGLPQADVGAERELLSRPEMWAGDTTCRVSAGHEAAAIAGLLHALPADASLRGLLAGMRRLTRHLSPLLQAAQAECWHQHLPATLWQALDRDLGLAAQAQQVWRHAAAVLHDRATGDATRRQVREQLAGHMSWFGHQQAGLLSDGSEALQAAWVLASAQSPRPDELPPGLRVGLLGLRGQAGVALRLHGQAQEDALCLRVHAPAAAPLGAAWAAVEDAPPVWSLQPLKPDADHPDPSAHPKLQPAAAPRMLQPGDAPMLEPGRVWRVGIGNRRLELEPFHKPDWVQDIGCDGGHWLATLPDGRRLRWVPQQDLALADQASVTYRLPHAAWWDEREYQHLLAADQRLRCPDWANAGHGVDDYGWWCAIMIAGVRQVFRYVPPGRFLMGSPESELDRRDDEVLHPVTLTHGFFLADTACTQALWLAVTGHNPSSFADDPECPVETVSWDDVTTILLPAFEHLRPGIGLELPSEAQWEYAARCAGHRAGSFGWDEDIDTNRANYDGNFPLSGGKRGRYRERTMPVKSFEPNPIGLWQMHGNVWEWCRTPWPTEYPTREELDPEGAASADADTDTDTKAALRVLRGGSWIVGARHCRSARRSAVGPGIRDGSIGFRLARGVLPARERAEPGPAVSGEAEPRPGGAEAPAAAAAARERGRGVSRRHRPDQD